MSNFRRKTILPRLMVTVGVALIAASVFFKIQLITEPYQTTLGGLLAFLGVFWFLQVSGIFRNR